MSYVAFIVPSKGALPTGSPYRAPINRENPFIECSFTLSQKSLVNEPTFRFPSRAPKERGAHFQSLPFTYPSVSPVDEAFVPGLFFIVQSITESSDLVKELSSLKFFVWCNNWGDLCVCV
jgi:hypothetical protein